MARKVIASFSNLVAILRHSFSQPMQRSTTFRFRYSSLSNPGRLGWFDFVGITSWIKWRRSHSRMLAELYALSPLSAFGRRRGRPRCCGMRTAFMTSSKCLDSCTCPGVTQAARGMPLPSVTKWILVPKPPRERPNAWASGSPGFLFFAPLRRIDARGRNCRRPQTDPNQYSLSRPSAFATPLVCGQGYRRSASDEIAYRPSTTAGSDQVDRAKVRRFLESRTYRSRRCDGRPKADLA